jgi:uncharacterized membrane protein
LTSRKHKRGDQQLAKKPENVTHRSLRVETFVGPLPHPDVLKKFEDIVPGAAKQIIEQANKQTDHRINIEKQVIQSDIRKSYLGLVFGFILGLVGIGGGIYATTLGHNVFGPLLSGGTLVSLVYAFIYGTKSRKEERSERMKRLSG